MVYDNIKRECEKRGMSITQLENKAGLANGTIGKWQKSSPTITNLKTVADILNVSVDWLLKD